MSETITADHLNATHLGKKISILDNCEIVMSGKLKELRTTQYSMPVYSNDIEAVPNGYGNITIAPKLNYETVTDIIMHLSNQLNDDIKATVHGDTELVIEVNGKYGSMVEDTTSKSTNELLMRVLQVESPELFDGSDYQPVRVVGYDYSPFCEAVCETCGDDPEMLTIAFETKSGERYSEYYDYFGLPNILEALGKWDKQYGMDNEIGRC